MRAVVIVPTYNEADNIQRFLTQVRSDAPNTDILVVDDNSPDGTSQIAKEAADRLGRIKVMTRTSKRGYAAASRDGMRAAISDN
ncbi:MAG: glycosyltransferase, partial [Acidimicrobiaceae bacterium]